MKGLFYRFILFLISGTAFAQAAYAQAACTRQAIYPATKLQQYSTIRTREAADAGKVAVYYVVPKDATYSQEEYEAVKKISRELQAWFRANTGGVTYTFASPDTVIVYNSRHQTDYYAADWRNLLLTEMQEQGEPVFENGTVASVWVKSQEQDGLMLGAPGCGGACGVAMAAIENIPAFNANCPGGTGEGAYPCVPHGVMGHSLGHAFGLVHPYNVEETKDVAGLSLMQTYWNYPGTAVEGQQPWGLLTTERNHLQESIFFQQGVPTPPLYEPNLVNLPATDAAPDIVLDVETDSLTVVFTNSTPDATLFYWTFGDGSTSNEQSPSHTYQRGGSYTVTLYASSDSAVITRQTLEVQLAEPLAAGDELAPGSIRAYPNPSQTGLYQLHLPPQPVNVTLTVSNVLGATVFSTTIQALQQDTQLDLRKYGQGTYFVRLALQDKSYVLRLVRL